VLDAATADKPTKLDGIPATVGRGAAWRPDGGEVVFAAQTRKAHLPAVRSCLRFQWMEQGPGLVLRAGFRPGLPVSSTEAF